jgi:hypothetical protein
MAFTKPEDWSETAASNTEINGIVLSDLTQIDALDNIEREHMAQIAKWLGDDTLASATTTDLGSVPGRYVSITGTTTITGLGTIKAGTIKYVKFAAALTLTHNATSLILPGAANITTAAGDTAILVSEGSGNWRCVAYTRAATGWQPPVITPWVAYTPTFTGFGTATSVAFRSRRVGGNLEIIGRFAAGTSTATEARITLGFNGTDGGLAVSSILNSANWITGVGAFTITGAAQCLVVVTGGQAYLKLGFQSSGREGLTPINGDVALPASGNVLAITASIPIEGW